MNLAESEEEVEFLKGFQFCVNEALAYQTCGIFHIELQFCKWIKVMQTFKLVKSEIETTYQKSSFMGKPALINVLPS